MRNLVNSLNKSFTGSVLLWVTDLLLPLCSTPPRPLLSPPGLWAPASGHPQPLPPTWMCSSPQQALTLSQAPQWMPCPSPLGMPFSVPWLHLPAPGPALIRHVLHPLGVQSALLSSTLRGHPPYLDQAAIQLRHSRFSVGALTLGLPICLH